MLRTTTRQEYGRRIARVMAYIGDHLDEELPLERLAHVACFSPYHFHRIYRSIAGETAADTVRRLRLHRAAVDLVRSDQPIADLAEAAGYQSVEAFTRAFAADHGEPPARFRERQRKAGTSNGGAAVEGVTIKHFNGVRLAVLPHRGDYQRVGSRFEELTAWAAANGLLAEPRRWFAIFYDDPGSVPEPELRSEAGVEIAPGTALGPGMSERLIAPGRVATIVHTGPYVELERVYPRLYRDWLPDSGEEADDRPGFEQYLNNPRETPPSECRSEIFLPLRD